MNTAVIARNDVSRPSRRKMEYPPAEITEKKWISHEDFWGEMEQKLNAHYGTNYKI